MHYRNLAAPSKGFHTADMRLPQSSAQRTSLRVISITTVLAFAAMLSLPARAATEQLVCSPQSLAFGDVVVGQSQRQDIVVTNTGQTSATVSAISMTGSGFTMSPVHLPTTLVPGESAAVAVTFAPGVTGSSSGQITVTSNAENPSLEVGLAGSGIQSAELTATPSGLSFGKLSVGGTSTKTVVVRNRTSSSVTINALLVAGAGYSVSGLSTPMNLGSGDSVQLSITFAPETAGISAGTVFLSGPQLNIPLTGTGEGAGQLSITPTSLNFGSVDLGNSTTQPSSMTATGGSITVTSANSSNSQFTIAGVSLPVTINSGQSIPFDVVFAPTQTGLDSATLSFSSNASNQGIESLSGTGVQPQYSVNLTWNPSTSQVVGYNVYRGPAPGSYSKINTAIDPNTAYTDGTVASGVTYYYAATSVNSSGEESTYSSPIKVSIP